MTVGSPTVTFFGLQMEEHRRIALERLFCRISDVASLPQTAQKIIEITTQENAAVDDVHAVIRTDPALLANILRRVNSSYYGLTTKVTDVRAAIALLGLREIRNLAVTIFLSKYLERPTHYRSYRRADLWDHCLAVAVAARLIARITGKSLPEEAYVAGLLHDFGFILMDQFLNKHFCLILDELDESQPTSEVESRILTFNHAMLGGFMARKWNFPQPAIDAITFHHRPLEYRGPHAGTLLAVVAANWVCSEAGRLSLGVRNVVHPEPEVFQRLGLDATTLDEITREVESSLATASLAT